MVVIAISGTPGTGKSTLSDYLVSYFNAHSLVVRTGGTTKLQELAKNQQETSELWKKYDVKKMISDNKLYDSIDESDGTFIVDTKKLIRFLINELEKDSNHNIVIDSFFSHILPVSVVDLCVICTCDI